MRFLKAIFGIGKAPFTITPAARPDPLAPPSNLQALIAGLAEPMHDYSGYTRECAIKECVRLQGTALLPNIAERLNDWVPQVREAARKAIGDLLPLASQQELIAVAPTVLALNKAGRVDHAAWIDQFARDLVERVGHDALLHAILHSETRVARACHAILLTHTTLRAEQLAILLSKKQPDILIASQTVMLISQLPADERLTLYRQALHCRFASVRAVAARGLLAIETPDTADRLAKDWLMQPQAKVRYEAVTYLRGRAIDPAGEYRTALGLGRQHVKRCVICLTMLSGMRQTEDLQLFKQSARTDAPLVRKAALEAWFRLVKSDKDLIATQALEDPAPEVRRFALYLVTREGAFVPLDHVQRILTERGDQPLLDAFLECGCLDVQRR